MASVSVSDVSVWPRASSPSRSSRKFSMIPLWITVMSPVQSWCGWALRSFGPAVGRPAGVGEADGGVGRPVRDRRLEVGELAGLLLDEQVALLVDEGDARPSRSRGTRGAARPSIRMGPASRGPV